MSTVNAVTVCKDKLTKCGVWIVVGFACSLWVYAFVVYAMNEYNAGRAMYYPCQVQQECPSFQELKREVENLKLQLFKLQ
jgi:hypothetical protein